MYVCVFGTTDGVQHHLRMKEKELEIRDLALHGTELRREITHSNDCNRNIAL